MTEEEAKTKWCPMVRKDNVDGDLHHRRYVGPEQTVLRYENLCIGSRCQMWRWEIANPNMQWTSQRFENDKFIVETSGTPQGYCGLAGKP